MAFWKALSECPRFALTIRAAVSDFWPMIEDIIMRDLKKFLGLEL